MELPMPMTAAADKATA